MPSGNRTASRKGSNSRRLASGRAASSRLACGLVDTAESVALMRHTWYAAFVRCRTYVRHGTGSPCGREGHIDSPLCGAAGREATKKGRHCQSDHSAIFSEPPQSSHRENIMRNNFTRKEFALAAACALALGFFSETALAQPATD